jgi:hypothetical protein
MDSSRIWVKGKNVDRIIDCINRDMDSYRVDVSPETVILFSEKYYFRNNSNLLLCIILNMESEEVCRIDIVSGGGGSGIAGSDWGAESSRIKDIEKIIKKFSLTYGWEVI